MKSEFAPPTLPDETALGRIMEVLGTIEDRRQTSKAMYPIRSVLLLVVAAIAGNASAWIDIEMYGRLHADVLKEYLNIERIPFRDTIQRVMRMISPALLSEIYGLWVQEFLDNWSLRR